MAAAAVATNFVDEYVGHVRVNTLDDNTRRQKRVDFFPGQVIQKKNQRGFLEYARIVDIRDNIATIIEIEKGITLQGKSNIQQLFNRYRSKVVLSGWRPQRQLSYTYGDMRPSQVSGKNRDDLMLAYRPDDAAEIIEENLIEYRPGMATPILGIFRSYFDELYYLIQIEGAPARRLRFLKMREGARLVPKNRRGTVSSNASSGTSASRGDGGTAHVDVDRRFENIESRLERIERRLDSVLPEDDEPIVPDADSLPSLSIRF
jgi:hypothetical protein